MSLSRLTIIPLIKSIVYNAHLFTAHTPSAIGPALNCYVSVCFGRAIFAVSDTRIVRERYEQGSIQADIPLFKSDKCFRGQYYENEVDTFGITKGGRSDKQYCVWFLSLVFSTIL